MSTFRLLRSLAILILILVARPSSAKIDEPKLAQWKWLMQYRDHHGSLRSKITTLDFFINKNGRDDASAELASALDLFRQILPPSENHPQCRYPARYRVLAKHFQLAPPVRCEVFESWLMDYGLSHVSLMYASQYLSNPASVFGHAFLLLGSSREDEYAQITFNYGADIPKDTGSISYAYKGLTGGFKGWFSTLPYYERLHVYTNMESRDLWEYKLNLSPMELELFAAYLWELKNRASLDYYFFDENCAAVLLWIFKAIKPEIDISTSNPVYVSPSEVVKILHRNNLSTNVTFHPSLTQRLLVRMGRMNGTKKTVFRGALSNKELSPSNFDPLVLDATIEHLNIERHRHLGQLPEELKGLERQARLQRAKTTTDYELRLVSEETPEPPHLSHGSMRLQLGHVSTSGTPAQVISVRPAFHGLLDREAGFLKNSSIEVLNTEFRLSSAGALSLERLTALEVSNFRSINLYEAPLSWSFGLALERNLFSGSEQNRYGEIAAKAGYARDLGCSAILAYALLDLRARTPAEPMGRLDLGPSLGVILSASRWKLNSEINLSNSIIGSGRTWLRVGEDLRFEISDHWSAFVSHLHRKSIDEQTRADEWKGSIAYYF